VHNKQAFDIYGLDYMMDDVVKNGTGKELEMRVKCTHRLKSAVPAGNLARMGQWLRFLSLCLCLCLAFYYSSSCFFLSGAGA
jgi:hypothetical protein